MLLILSLLDEPPGQITAAAWTIICTLAGAVSLEAVYIAKLHLTKAAELKALYEERIKELKSQVDLVETLLDVIDKEKKGGGDVRR